MKPSLRILSASATIALLAAPLVAIAKPTLYVGAYGGSYERAFKTQIIPPFEKAHNVNVVYVAGNSTATLAKLQAAKGHEQLNVVLLDDGPMYQAINYGFCAKLGNSIPLHNIFGFAKFPHNDAVGIGVVATGLAYNKRFFKAKGWSKPTSWLALTNPKYKGFIAIPPITNTYGLHALIMMAKLHGGGVTNINPGFKTFISKINPSVLSYVGSPGRMSELFQNNQIALAVWGSGRVKALADTGFPVGFVYPKQGAVALVSGACAVKQNKLPKLSQQFIADLVSPKTQVILAKAVGNGPINIKTKLPSNLAAALPYGPKESKLIKIDWSVVNKHRTQWTNRWDQQVEK